MPVFFRQNRWMMPLFGVILACFSAIIILAPMLGQDRERAKPLGGELRRTLTLTSAASRAEADAGPREDAFRTARSGTISANAPDLVNHLHKSLSPAIKISSAAWKAAPGLHVLDPGRIIRISASESAARGAGAPVRVIGSGQVLKRETVLTKKQGVQPKVKKAVIPKSPPIILYFSRTKLLSRDERSQATRSYTVSNEEVLLLQKIVMAEAEGEPYEGKVAVANVVLNRLRSANFPKSIRDVVYQKHQFSPVANGRLKRVHPNADTVKAVSAALSGKKAVSDDTYYFLSLKLAQDLTVHHSRTFTKKIGNHSFYR